MMKFSAWMILLFAGSMGLSGCQTKGGAADGSGFIETKPNLGTVNYIRENDRQFADDVATNNRACKRSPGCKKKGG